MRLPVLLQLSATQSGFALGFPLAFIIPEGNWAVEQSCLFLTTFTERSLDPICELGFKTSICHRL